MGEEVGKSIEVVVDGASVEVDKSIKDVVDETVVVILAHSVKQSRS